MIKNQSVTIFVNLKRFDVPVSRSGICPSDDPGSWIESVISETVALGLGRQPAVELVYILPESLLITAGRTLGGFDASERSGISIGSQSVYRQDCVSGGNFGAFTASLPASAAASAGAGWAMIGHSEERRDKLGIIATYDGATLEGGAATERANAAVDTMMADQVCRALESRLDVLLCVGETAEQRGDGPFEQQRPRVQATLAAQLERGLTGAAGHLDSRRLVIGYEPVWAIGPGRTPPDSDYVDFVATFIKEATRRITGRAAPVVYGGGLKEQNAGALGAIEALDGGLVALTTFTAPLAFRPVELAAIVRLFLQTRAGAR